MKTIPKEKQLFIYTTKIHTHMYVVCNRVTSPPLQQWGGGGNMTV